MENQIIFTKLEVEWYIIRYYLETIGTIGASYKDESFCKMLNGILSYVERKLELRGKGDIIDTYVAVLQEP